MIKRIYMLVALFIALVLVLTSCNGSNNADNKTSNNNNEPIELKQKYVIELNLDNYQKYIDLRAEAAGNYNRLCFYGSLSYAFYEDVVITYTYSYDSKEHTISLSTGGYGFYYSSADYFTHTVTNVSGRVIYWI